MNQNLLEKLKQSKWHVVVDGNNLNNPSVKLLECQWEP